MRTVSIRAGGKLRGHVRHVNSYGHGTGAASRVEPHAELSKEMMSTYAQVEILNGDIRYDFLESLGSATYILVCFHGRRSRRDEVACAREIMHTYPVQLCASCATLFALHYSAISTIHLLSLINSIPVSKFPVFKFRSSGLISRLALPTLQLIHSPTLLLFPSVGPLLPVASTVLSQ